MTVITVAGLIQGKQPSASIPTPIQIQTLRLEYTNSEERVILMSMSMSDVYVCNEGYYYVELDDTKVVPSCKGNISDQIVGDESFVVVVAVVDVVVTARRTGMTSLVRKVVTVYSFF